MEMNVNGNFKKVTVQSGLDEGPGGGGGGGALPYLASVLNGYVPDACLCKDQFGIWGVV